MSKKSVRAAGSAPYGAAHKAAGTQRPASVHTSAPGTREGQPAKISAGANMICPYASRCFSWLIVAAFFVGLWCVMGDVFVRTQMDSYVSTSGDTMKYVLDQPLGWLLVLGRWMLLPFRWAWVAAGLLTLVFSATVCLFARVLPRKSPWRPLLWLVPLAELGWMAWRGLNLWYRAEGAWAVLVPVLVLLLSAVTACVAEVFKRRRASRDKLLTSNLTTENFPKWHAATRLGLTVAMLCLVAGSFWAIRVTNENVIFTARMQNLLDRREWDAMKEVALSARRPTRSIALYYAIACEYTGTLLNDVFNIPFDYPELNLDKHEGAEEYGIFEADGSLYAGLVDTSTRNTMDRIVMHGPSTAAYRRMAQCAMLNGEEALCRRYLKVLREEPGNGDFCDEVEQYLPFDSLRISTDPTWAHLLRLRPMERKYEQNYEKPCFLGYNLLLSEGTNQTLLTSSAVVLYRKSLDQLVPRAQFMVQKGMELPLSVQQAIAILAIKNESLRNFPGVKPYVQEQLRAFLTDARPYFQELKEARIKTGQPNTAELVEKQMKEDPLVREARLKVRHEMKERWLGSYFYYYYTENNDPDQILVVTHEESSSAGVN